MKNAIIDYRTDDETITNIKKYGYNVIKTIKNSTDTGICGHSDIQVCKISDNCIITSKESHDYYKSFEIKSDILCGNKNPKYPYPNDVCYNAFINNDVCVHNLIYIDKKILSVIEQKNLKCINVKQGYSKCNICEISNNAIITEDTGIANILTANGFDVLKISSGNVRLTGFNHGFIGGATGLDENKLLVNGELKFHPDEKNIRNFLEKYNITLLELKKGLIYDIGSIIIIN